MKVKQQNIYLNALEYGEKKLIEKKSINRNELTKYLESRGYKFSTNEERRLLNTLGEEAFSIYRGTEPSNRRYYLNITGYFKLLEYRGIMQARKYAFVAILVSVILLLTSIIFSIIELSTR